MLKQLPPFLFAKPRKQPWTMTKTLTAQIQLWQQVLKQLPPFLFAEPSKQPWTATKTLTAQTGLAQLQWQVLHWLPPEKPSKQPWTMTKSKTLTAHIQLWQQVLKQLLPFLLKSQSNSYEQCLKPSLHMLCSAVTTRTRAHIRVWWNTGTPK